MMRSASLVAVIVMALSLAGLATAQAPAPAANPQAAAGQPSGRAPIQAKTQEEYQAYQAAVGNAQNPPAMEKAADDFAAKFPTSDLRVLLYRAACTAIRPLRIQPRCSPWARKFWLLIKTIPRP